MLRSVLRSLATVVVSGLLFACSVASFTPEPSPPTVPGAVYVGDEVCGVCHAAEARAFNKTVHARLDTFEGLESTRRCEGCHGQGSRHVQSRGRPELIVRRPKAKRDSAGACLRCHQQETRFEWLSSEHERADVSCVDCHDPMRASERLLRQPEPALCFTCHPEQRAQFSLPSRHPLHEGAPRCTDCHNPHGSTRRALLRADSTNELCQRCHVEKEGPFVYEHPPVTESCALCHEPHGSVAESLLVQTEPFLCLSCHAGHQGPLPPLTEVTRAPDKRATFYTKCTQCHSTIHGSDLPSTSSHGRFTR